MNLAALTAYELIKEENLTDIHAKGYLLRHKKSGAKISLISNDDENKVFYIGFRTPVEDSTGVPHIIEHTVLCGSDKFPVKDPFVELVKGSLNTFLNAMTYPDKTVYPVASCNDKDFANLMDVYLDAVFHPNIYKKEEIFKQEGWHYELEDRDAPVTINGVVYNEMKGAFSSPEGVLDRVVLNSLFPDTTYSNESGGDPEVIPELTYEQYLDFHRKFYHPCNSYIYLYGNMDMEEKLEFLDKEYLSHYDKIEVDSAIQLQAPFEKPVTISKPYSIASSESLEDNAYLSYNVAIGTNLESELTLAFDVLDYALLSAPGAPLKQALIDAGIGKDIMGGFDNSTLQPIFSVVAKNANKEDEEKFVGIIEDTLKKIVKDGLNRKSLLAGINSEEFKFREADYGNFPKGLIYGLSCMDSWLYDDDEPFLYLKILDVFAALKEKIETGYFEELIQKYLLDNSHKSYVSIEPEKGLNARLEKELEEKLAAYKNGLSEEEIDKLVEDTKHLKLYQEEPSPKEDLMKIPMLKRQDMKREAQPLVYEKVSCNGIETIHTNIYSNGIHYLNLMFDNVRLLTTNSSSELFEQMVRIGENDVIIGISFPRYSMRTLKALEFANNRSAKVITITDSIHSPMNLYSSCNLIADSDMASIVDSLVAPLSVINALVVALCMKKQKEVAGTLTMLEDIWDEYQVYENDEINYIDDSIKVHYAKLGDIDNE